MSYGTCSSCGGEVLWARTVHGKRMPLDPAPRADGNLAIYRDHLGRIRVRVLGKSETPEPYETRGVAHFATCPYADRHRAKADGLPGNVIRLDTGRQARR